MEVATAEAASGQGSPGNTGQANSLSDAITAAIQAQRDTDKPEEKTPEATPKVESVEKAGDKRDGEDARSPEVSDAKAGNEGEAAPKEGDATKTFEAPAHWPEARRKAFAAMKPEDQALIRDLAKDLEGGFTRKSQELGSKAKLADALSSLIDDTTRQHLAATGANEVQYFQHLDRVQKFAASDGPGYLRWATQSMGLKPEQVFPDLVKQPPVNQAATNGSTPELDALLADPRVSALEAEFAKLNGRLSDRERAEQVREQQKEVWYRQQLEGMAGQFRSQLNDDGQLQYPHYDQVTAHMGALMSADPKLKHMADSPEKLQAAYDMAVWARPDLRQSLIEVEASKRVAAAKKAEEVARAKSITAIKPASGVATTPAKSQSLDDIIRSAMGR